MRAYTRRGIRAIFDGTGAEVVEHRVIYPGFDNLVFDSEGTVPAHINIYVNNREIHELGGTETPVADGDQVAVIPALAGGADDGAQPAASVALTPEEAMRYSRHIIMGQVGSIGQRKLRNAKVLVVVAEVLLRGRGLAHASCPLGVRGLGRGRPCARRIG